MARSKSRKKPCSICRKWFLPDNRQGINQKTCSETCRRKRHRRQCKEWNDQNKKQAKANYLSKKLETIETAQREKPNVPINLPAERINLNLPRDLIQETIGAKPLIIIEYIIEQVSHRIPLTPCHPDKGQPVFKTRQSSNHLKSKQISTDYPLSSKLFSRRDKCSTYQE
jgi:hypothetical protein